MKKERFAPWLKQPDGPVGINKGHPRADGLEFFAPLSGAHGTLDLVRSQLGTRTGLEAYLPAQNGALHHLFGASNYASFTEVLSAIGTTTPITIAWTQEPRSTSGQSAIIDWQFGTGGTHPSFTVYQSASLSGYYFNVGPRGSGGGVGDSVSFSASVGAVTNDKLDRYVLRCLSGVLDRTGAGYDLWRNGVQIAGTTDAANKFGWATPSTMRIGALADGSDPFEGLIGDFRIWSRVLSDGDAAAESTLPEAYALYAPRRILVPVSAGGSVSLTVADATHAHTADGLVLTSSTALAVAEATHAHTADAITLVAGSVLTIAEAIHAHTADSPTLTAASALAVADATHSHAADILTLSAASVLAVADATHAHAADATALTMDSTLAVAETLHAQAADNLVLGVAGTTNLVVADAAHAHSADVLALTSAHALVVADAIHGHSVEGLTLSVASVLAIQEALHAHAAENLALETTGSAVLLLANSLHAHTSDGAVLTVDAWLVVADAAHGHSADNVVFTFGGAIPTDTLPMMVSLQNSYMLVAPERSLMIVRV